MPQGPVLRRKYRADVDFRYSCCMAAWPALHHRLHWSYCPGGGNKISGQRYLYLRMAEGLEQCTHPVCKAELLQFTFGANVSKHPQSVLGYSNYAGLYIVKIVWNLFVVADKKLHYHRVIESYPCERTYVSKAFRVLISKESAVSSRRRLWSFWTLHLHDWIIFFADVSCV